MGQTLTAETTYILPNEKVYALVEVNATPLAMGMPITSRKAARGYRRYRIIWVNRDGQLAVYKEESPNPVTATPVRIPCLFEHTVAEACAIADHHARVDSTWERDLALEKQASSTLHRDIGDQIERTNLMRQNRTTIGPHVRVQRNGYPRYLQRMAKPRNAE